MKENHEVMKTGTTTVGIVCSDGIILAADKRATLGGGYVINHDIEKVIILTENIAVTMAGNVSDVQLLLKLLKAEIQIKKMRREKDGSVKEAANLLARMVYNNIRKMSMLQGVSHFILAGRDESGIHLYDIFPDGSINEVKTYVSSGSGSIYGAYSVFDTLYNKGINIADGTKLVVKAINAAMQRDTASGDGIDIVAITDKGIKKILTKQLNTKLEI
ncbi:MAG: proteasome subunit beta [Nanoarchaeota archaeon]|nr:proteasome subunit beta [Nanoarchaeota archaeon]MBU0962967.1 proteasome subunit beta [Nanoarchaeota archaeon]